MGTTERAVAQTMKMATMEMIVILLARMTLVVSYAQKRNALLYTNVYNSPC